MAGLARWCFRQRYIVIALWIAAIAVLGVVNHAAGSAYSDSFTLPGTESKQALQLLQSAFPGQSGESDTIVWHVPSGKVTDPDVQQPISAMLTKVAAAPSVASVGSPYSGAQGSLQISPDGQTAYAKLVWKGIGQQNSKADVENVIKIADSARTTGVQVELGGQAIQAVNQVSTNLSEGVGFIAAALILLLAFGSFFAMLLPIVSAIFSVIGGTFAIGLLSHGLAINNIAPIFATLIGVGVGVDYALFIVTRHRNGLKAGLSAEESAVRALNTSGRAVLFAGATVCIAMLGLLVLRLNFLTGIGVGSAMMVLFTVFASITLLPAMLSVMGTKVLSRKERRVLATTGAHDEFSVGFWARWSAYVSRRPKILALGAIIVIAVLTIPLLSLRLGTGDQGNDPATSTTRKAYDLLADGFGPGFNGPLQLVAKVSSPQDAQALTGLVTKVQATEGVKSAFEIPMKPGDTVGVVQVVPTTSPEDAKTTQLINRLRQDVIPPSEQGNSLHVYVGGSTAIFNDFSKVITGKLPLFIARDRRTRVPAAADRVPQHRRAVDGRRDEPAGSRRLVRRRRRVLPVRLGFGSARTRSPRTDRRVRTRADVGGFVRSFDGLPGLPGEPHARGMGAHEEQPGCGHDRSGVDRAGDHGRRDDHDLRVPRVRVRRAAGRR